MKQRRLQTITCAAGLIALVATAAASSSSCYVDEDAYNEQAFTRLTYYFDDADGAGQIKADLIASIEEADDEVDIALARLTDTELADALIEAAERGVRVRVVTDEQARGDAGIRALEDAEDVSVVYGDGELKYLPEPTLTSLLGRCQDGPEEEPPYIQCTSSNTANPDQGLMVRPDDYNLMSNNFVIIDDLIVWSLSSPMAGSPTYWFGWRAHSQDMAIAFSAEFQQMAGEVFSTTLDIYNGPVKSEVHGIVYDSHINANRPGRHLELTPGYLTDEGIVRVEFNPQQRLIKEVIDEIYRARGSVFLMTDELYHDFAIDALKYKAERGFDVRVIVRDGAVVSEDFQELIELGVVRTAPPEIEYVPTVLVTDAEPDRHGRQWARTAQVLTHSFYRSTPFNVLGPQEAGVFSNTDVVRIYRSDLFVDGTLWTMREFLGGDPETHPIERLTRFWLSTWDDADALE